MDYFKEAYNSLIEWIEDRYEINLTNSEKLSLKYCLKYAQEVCAGRTLEEKVGGFQMFEAEMMWLNQYGITYSEIRKFEDYPEAIIEHVRRIREECILP